MKRTPSLRAAIEFFLDLLDGSNADRARRPAAPREIRQRVQRRPGAAKIGEESTKGSRADVLRPDEPEPVEALLIGKAHLGIVSHSL